MRAQRLLKLGRIAVMSLLVVASGRVMSGQSLNPGPLSFEVASIRPNRTESVMFDEGVRIQPDGSAVAVNTPLMKLIGFAYGLDGMFRTLEGASGLFTERFDVIGKGAGPSGAVGLTGEIGPVNLMMQALLAERFKLAATWEERARPGYVLVRARPDGAPGPRMRATQRDCSDPATYREKPPGDSRGCALTVINNELTAAGHSMADLSRYISRYLNRPVLDRTGLVGPYDIQMSFNAALLRARNRASPPQPSELPSLFVALEEQLGLRLEDQRVMTQVLVVTHVEPPSEN